MKKSLKLYDLSTSLDYFLWYLLFPLTKLYKIAAVPLQFVNLLNSSVHPQLQIKQQVLFLPLIQYASLRSPPLKKGRMRKRPFSGWLGDFNYAGSKTFTFLE